MKGHKHESPYAVICGGLMEGYTCGSVPLTEEQYSAMLMDADYPWRCPQCGARGEYDEDNDPTITEAPDDR